MEEDMTGEDFAQPRQRRRRIEAASVTSFERKIVEAIETSNCPAPAGSEDPDMQFLQSLMPALKRLEPKCRELSKLKIHKLTFEAEFNCEFWRSHLFIYSLIVNNGDVAFKKTEITLLVSPFLAEMFN